MHRICIVQSLSVVVWWLASLVPLTAGFIGFVCVIERLTISCSSFSSMKVFGSGLSHPFLFFQGISRSKTEFYNLPGRNLPYVVFAVIIHRRSLFRIRVLHATAACQTQHKLNMFGFSVSRLLQNFKCAKNWCICLPFSLYCNFARLVSLDSF